MPIIARVNHKTYEIANNETYTITDIKDNIIVVENDDQIIEININEFQRLFYLSFAVTTYKSQGSTFNHPYTIHEWNKFDNRMKYVALSRTSKKEYINII